MKNVVKSCNCNKYQCKYILIDNKGVCVEESCNLMLLLANRDQLEVEMGEENMEIYVPLEIANIKE